MNNSSMPFRFSFSFIYLGLNSLLLFNCLAQPAYSQRDSDPNFNHFYMGRQQWTVEDNSPVIINRTGTAPGASTNGALPGRATPLPKAGWQGYAPIDNPAPNPNLPKTPGPIRQAPASVHAKAGQKGHPGNLTAKPPSGVQGYKPYATYNNPVNTPSPGADLNSTQHVKGSLLHWARRAPKQQ